MSSESKTSIEVMIKNVHPEQFSLFSNSETVAAEVAENSPPTGQFSNFIVYVDESGDHGMQTLDQNYQVFVLAFCVFFKKHFCEAVVPAIQKFKFNHFGHNTVVLHENDIRKEKGAFRFKNRHHKQCFLDQLTSIIEDSNFIFISCVIDKGGGCETNRSSNLIHTIWH